MNRHKPFERIGHRGAPRECIENTMASFRRAVALGADAVELDVHVTRDGVPVVHHDPELGAKVSPPELAKAAISSLTAVQVASVRLAGREPVPVLSDLLDELAPQVFVYVELKGGSPEAVAAVVKKHVGSAAMHSFDHEAIVSLRAIAPEIPRGILVERFDRKQLAAEIERTGATDLWPDKKLVNAELMRLAADAGARVIPWTVNAPDDAARLRELGVAGVCTDDLSILGPR